MLKKENGYLLIEALISITMLSGIATVIFYQKTQIYKVSILNKQIERELNDLYLASISNLKNKECKWITPSLKNCGDKRYPHYIFDQKR